MIDNYDALPLGTYMRVNAVLDGDGDELEKQVQILAILSDKATDELLLLPLADYADMAKQSAFLRVPCKPATIGEDYRYQDLAPVLDFRKINTAQYIDFQTFAKDFPKSFPQLLSVFLVPAGMAYNDGYDIAVVQEQVKGIPMPEALGLAAFFLERLLRLTEDSLTSLDKEMRRMKDPEKRKEIRERITRIQTLLQSAGDGLPM